MAIKVAAYIWLTNNYLLPIVKNQSRVTELSDKDKKGLQRIIDELDNLHEVYVSHSPKPIVGPHVMIAGGFEEVRERSKNPQRTAQLFNRLHTILRRYRVESNVYKLIGEAFEEHEIQPNLDAAAAITYGTRLANERFNAIQRDSPYYSSIPESFCWEDVRIKPKKRKGLTIEDFIPPPF